MNNVLTRRKGLIPRLCNAGYTELDVPVQSGLALTPAKVKELAEKGIAVSTANSDGLFDASPDFGNYKMDDMYESGMTREELWERSQMAKKKVFFAKDKLSAKQRKVKVESQKTK